MLWSLGLIFLCSMLFGYLFGKVKLPHILGMLFTGVLLGPYVLNLLDPIFLESSNDWKQIALIIIIARAGLSLDIKDLIKVGRPAVLMCFVPAFFEIVGVMIIAPILWNISLLEAALMGTVIAAVSPAIVVPGMLKLMESGYGLQKRIPQLVMAGATMDDVFVLILFSAIVGLLKSKSISMLRFFSVPTSIILGILVGAIAGLALTKLFTRFHIRDTGKVVTILSISFLLVSFEHRFAGPVIGFSGLLATMSLGVTIQHRKFEVAKRLSGKFSKLWVGAESILFVLVGATLNLNYMFSMGALPVFLILGALLFRISGVFLSLAGTALNGKERLFTAISYMPKATVQAAIGGLPLAMGLPSGDLVLTVAVISIIITAPVGATLMNKTYKQLLSKGESAVVSAHRPVPSFDSSV